MTSVFAWILEHLPWPAVASFLRRLGRYRRWALLTSATLLLLAVVLTYWYWDRSTRYETVVRDTLQQETMPTPQLYKGLEAFIISSIPSDPRDDLAKKKFGGAFLEALRHIPAEVDDAKMSRKTNVDIAVGNGGIVLTDDVANGYLFLPVHVLRRTPTQAQREILNNRSPAVADVRRTLIGGLLDADPELRRDIAFTAALAPILARLANTSVTTDTADRPEQVYVITKNGVNRIMSANRAGNSGYQFPESTFFPSRPYFWPVFDAVNPRRARRLEDIAPATENATITDYFTISHPYMDLGGSGLVVTLARGIMVDGYPLAVLCIDLPVHARKSLPDLIRDRIRKLGGYTMTVTCDVATQPHCRSTTDLDYEKRPNSDPLLMHMESTLKDRFVRQRRAEVLGNIIVMTSDGSSASRIQASVPLGPVSNTEEQFLLLSLDLVSFRRLTSTIGLAAAISFGLMTLLLAYFWGLQVQESREYREAFERVAEVMTESPTPYVRLTAEDRFHDFSGSFLQLLGLGADEAKVLPERTFKSFLADDKSREIYESVENRRREHKDVSPQTSEDRMRIARVTDSY